MTAQDLIGVGKDADVYALDAHRVLRRYRDGGSVTEEAAVMAYVAGHGFPVPAVYEADGPDLVMQRLTGSTLLASFAVGQTSPADGGAILADLHRRLHALPPRHSDDPAARILHLDLHPDNVLLTPAGPVLIDWRNSTEGSPDFDLAVTGLIIAEVAVGLHQPGFEAPAAELLREFCGRAGGQPLARLPQAVAYRTANPTLTAAEKAELGRAAATLEAAFAPI